jgi:hypothetical protein
MFKRIIVEKVSDELAIYQTRAFHRYLMIAGHNL